MIKTTCLVGGANLDAYVLDTAIVGTGCAGFSCAGRLHARGRTDIAIITEGINTGTSRNTGSDKQTYYKLTLSGDDSDSVRAMAQTLFDGQCVDGDHALCEAALSAKCFLRLADMGVKFPTNRYGEYIGYKTDHDPRRRATSAGPLTSKQMTEALERDVRARGIEILDKLMVIALLEGKERIRGLLCLDLTSLNDAAHRFKVVLCNNVVYATGGPAGIYQDSCYPAGHSGMTGIAFEAGTHGKNLTEWQYGLASIAPRWNVSGTFMQVLPRFVSCAQDMSDEREFLQDYISDPGELLTNVFLKGYQWPFDSRKAMAGSSLIDLIVYNETKVKGRRVFLDFTRNPLDNGFDMELLSKEAHDYLESAGALFGTPVERLAHMNQPAIDFYLSRGVDLHSEKLEIALCSQHNNGGINVDRWWQTDVPGLFAVGEAAASHGVYRPGGSALNAGQVGAERAATFIASQPEKPVNIVSALAEVDAKIERIISLAGGALTQAGYERPPVKQRLNEARQAMSVNGAAVRDAAAIEKLISKVRAQLMNYSEQVGITGPQELPEFYRLRDTLLSQLCYLNAMSDYVHNGGLSRGSALYTDANGEKPLDALPESCRHIVAEGAVCSDENTAAIRAGKLVQEVSLDGLKCNCKWRAVRPIPEDDDFFENVWRGYRENGNVY